MSTAAIVTGTDGSDSASEAVRQAAELADSSGLPLHLVSAHASDVDPATRVRAILDAGRDALAGLAVEVHLHAVLGTPADALCAVATRVGAELIVVGNKGEDTSFGLRRSISEQVQRKAPCPVLVVDTRAYWP
jgi:nucleotide-binding universal stress UspA family protein